MKKLLLGVLLVSSNLLSGQNIDSINRNLESINSKTDSMIMEWQPDSAQMARDREMNNRNLDALVRTMKEREKKQQRQMWLRIGFGVVLLGVGIYSFVRKKKKAD